MNISRKVPRNHFDCHDHFSQQWKVGHVHARNQDSNLAATTMHRNAAEDNVERSQRRNIMSMCMQEIETPTFEATATHRNAAGDNFERSQWLNIMSMCMQEIETSSFEATAMHGNAAGDNVERSQWLNIMSMRMQDRDTEF